MSRQKRNSQGTSIGRGNEPVMIRGIVDLGVIVGRPPAPTSAQLVAECGLGRRQPARRVIRVGRRGRGAATPTHFVSPDGGSQLLHGREPCSLARAVALIGTADVRPGSLVLVQHGADGVYSQAALTFDGSGMAAEPIRFIGENGVRLTGTRARVSASQWTRVPDREFTDRIAWDGSASFAVADVPPASSRDDVAADPGGRASAPFTQ